MNLPKMADLPKKPVRTGYSHIVFSVGSIEKSGCIDSRIESGWL